MQTAASFVEPNTFEQFGCFDDDPIPGFQGWNLQQTQDGSLGLNFLINLLAFSAVNLPRKILLGTLTKYLTIAGLSTVYVLVAFEIVLAVLHPETAAGLTGTRVAIIASGTLIRFFLYRHWVFRAQEDRG